MAGTILGLELENNVIDDDDLDNNNTIVKSINNIVLLICVSPIRHGVGVKITGPLLNIHHGKKKNG